MEAVLVSEHPGQTCVLGIDVAKFELMAMPRWPEGQRLRGRLGMAKT